MGKKTRIKVSYKNGHRWYHRHYWVEAAGVMDAMVRFASADNARLVSGSPGWPLPWHLEVPQQKAVDEPERAEEVLEFTRWLAGETAGEEAS